VFTVEIALGTAQQREQTKNPSEGQLGQGEVGMGMGMVMVMG